MKPRILDSKQGLQEVVTYLRAGELVAIPTETVYGLAADAGNAEAVAKVFAAKGRPADHPLIVHVASAEIARTWAAQWPASAARLAAAFWPGPLTLIVRRAVGVLDAVTGGQDTVGLRVPSHPVAQQLLQQFAGGLAAPSANRFGHVSPTTAAHVAAEFADLELLIIEGGASEVGVESTIVDLSGDGVRVLRPGRIRSADIERVVGVALITSHAAAPRVSGALPSHYAPSKPTLLVSGADLQVGCPSIAVRERSRMGVLFYSDPLTAALYGKSIQVAANAAQYEHDLYAAMRALDECAEVERILIEAPPVGDDWEAVNDRLRRATYDTTVAEANKT